MSYSDEQNKKNQPLVKSAGVFYAYFIDEYIKSVWKSLFLSSAAPVESWI